MLGSCQERKKWVDRARKCKSRRKLSEEFSWISRNLEALTKLIYCSFIVFHFGLDHLSLICFFPKTQNIVFLGERLF